MECSKGLADRGCACLLQWLSSLIGLEDLKMERTNYVAKAKSLMMRTVRTTALVIVPLAAAVNAHAGAIALPIGNYTCAYVDNSNSTSGSCSGGDSQQASLGSGVQGMS